MSAANVVAGERRLRAAKRLGWKTVPACDLGKISEKELRDVELEENIRRKQLTDYETAKRLRDFVENKPRQSGAVSSNGGRGKIGGTKQAAREIGVPETTLRRAANHANTADRAGDESLRRMADRIQARAIRRCGELLKTFDGRGRPGKNSNGTVVVSQGKAAGDAHLSQRQKETAVRVANIPREQFEKAVESEKPPTVTALAERGKASRPRPILDLGGRNEEEFALSTAVVRIDLEPRVPGHPRSITELAI